MPSSYQVTPAILGRRRATQRIQATPASTSRPGRQPVIESARRRPEDLPARSDVTGPQPETLTQRPVIRDGRPEGPAIASRFPAAFRPPAFASRSSHSRQGIGSPHGRPTDPRGAGPRRGYRVPHARAATGVGAPYTPRTVVLTRLGRLPDRHPPLLSGSPSTPPRHPTMRGCASRGINRGSITFTRPVFPSPAPPGVEPATLRLPPSFAPRRHQQRTSGAGTGHRARTWNYRSTHIRRSPVR